MSLVLNNVQYIFISDRKSGSITQSNQNKNIILYLFFQVSSEVLIQERGQKMSIGGPTILGPSINSHYLSFTPIIPCRT